MWNWQRCWIESMWNWQRCSLNPYVLRCWNVTTYIRYSSRIYHLSITPDQSVICGFYLAPLQLTSGLNPAPLPFLSGSNSAPLPVLGGFNPAPLPDTCGIIQHHCQTKVVIIQHRLPVISAKEARTFQLFQLI